MMLEINPNRKLLARPSATRITHKIPVKLDVKPKKSCSFPLVNSKIIGTEARISKYSQAPRLRLPKKSSKIPFSTFLNPSSFALPAIRPIF